MGLPDIYANCAIFGLGDNPDMADSGLRDVINGKQIATSGSFDLLNKDPDEKPYKGKIEIVLNGKGQPGCAIQFWKVDTVKFCDVDAQFAKDEACETLEEWGAIHEGYYKRKGNFSPTMKLYRLYFKVVEVFATEKEVV